jgi:hypothetical protein
LRRRWTEALAAAKLLRSRKYKRRQNMTRIILRSLAAAAASSGRHRQAAPQRALPVIVVAQRPDPAFPALHPTPPLPRISPISAAVLDHRPVATLLQTTLISAMTPRASRPGGSAGWSLRVCGDGSATGRRLLSHQAGAATGRVRAKRPPFCTAYQRLRLLPIALAGACAGLHLFAARAATCT